MNGIYLVLQLQDILFPGQSVTGEIDTSIFQERIIYASILLDSNSKKLCGNTKLALEQAALCILCYVFWLCDDGK